MMLSCKQSSALISQSLDRNLTRRERFSLRFHLLICKYCKRFSQQIATLRVAIQQAAMRIEADSSIEMSSATKARIASSLDQVVS